MKIIAQIQTAAACEIEELARILRRQLHGHENDPRYAMMRQRLARLDELHAMRPADPMLVECTPAELAQLLNGTNVVGGYQPLPSSTPPKPPPRNP